jgi:hypothetical protein
MEIMIALFCLFLVVAGLIAGCGNIRPGHLARWTVYGACSCFVVGGVWLNVLPATGFATPTQIEQIVAILLVTVALKWMMENAIGYWL